MTKRIGILGAGGMGSAFAALLARAGMDVVLVGRGSAHVRAVQEHGLTVHLPDGDSWAVNVGTRAHAADLAEGELAFLIVLTKAFDTVEAASGAAHALATEGVAVSLQNGLGLDTALAGVFGSDRALVGTTTVGATLREPGHISITAATAAGRSMNYFGQMGAATGGGRGAELAELLTAAALPAEYVAQIGTHVWQKLALAVMSPVSSTLRTTVAKVWSTDEGRSLVEQMFDEVVDVAASEGVALDRDAAWTNAAQVFEGTGEHYTSMCTDAIKGRRTELASMAGAVERLGRDNGVPVPAHSVVLRLLAAAGVN